MSQRQRVAVDFDGTIADTNQTKAAWVAHHLRISLEPWQCDRSTCVPIIGNEMYERMANIVYDRESTLATGQVPGAIAALKRLSSTADLFIVTARPLERMEFAKEWFREFNAETLIQTFYSSKGTSKEAICRTIAADVLVDDDIRHLGDVQLTGLRRLHFRQFKNEPVESVDGVTTCSTWAEILSVLNK